MQDESPRAKIDTKRLETIIDDLRCAIITLILVVSLLAGYIILQYLQLSSITYLSDPRLYFVGLIVFLLLLAFWFTTSKKE